MPSEGRERGVTVVIGAVLMFGLLVSALAMYQVNVVPTENEQTEWDHHQRVTGDLIDLRNAIVNAGNQDTTREASIELGAQYDSRTFSINPPDPGGTIRTNSTGTPQVEITFDDGSTESFDTSFVEYEPDYTEYDAPTTIIEHGLVYDEHGHVNVTRDAGSVVSDERIVVPLIEGDLSESGRSSASVTVETIDVYHVSSDVDEIRLPTNAYSRWDDSYEVSESGDHAVVDPKSDQEVYVAQIAVGDDRTANTDTSDKLNEFGDPVTDRGSPTETNEFGLAWTDDSVTASPGNSVTLTATIDDDVENAYADFSLRDPNDVVDDYDPKNRIAFDENAEASFDVALANTANDGDEVTVYVSSGGTTREATVTVQRGSGAPTIDNLDARSQDHSNHARFDAEWEATAGDSPITAATIELVDRSTGTVEDTVSYDASDIDGQNPSDSGVSLEDKQGAGQEYSIRLTVEDANGNVAIDEIVRTG
ncbi:hypothetical protein [Halovivax cerinus]|uniref:Archaeal flagellin-like protein n=1 Tax=Halovivax cerinus TaxID=1487865 RepID=A0ABD5NNV0_9EURY|nr:hypothetical protein [Halovivax cerinus]